MKSCVNRSIINLFSVSAVLRDLISSVPFKTRLTEWCNSCRKYNRYFILFQKYEGFYWNQERLLLKLFHQILWAIHFVPCANTLLNQLSTMTNKDKNWWFENSLINIIYNWLHWWNPAWKLKINSAIEFNSHGENVSLGDVNKILFWWLRPHRSLIGKYFSFKLNILVYIFISNN